MPDLPFPRPRKITLTTSPLEARVRGAEAAWYRDWLLDLPRSLPGLLDWCARNDPEGAAWPGRAQALLDALRSRLLVEPKFAVLRFGTALDEQRLRSLFLRLGEHFGENVSRSGRGENRRCIELTNRRDPTLGGVYTGNAFHDRDLAPHVDGAGDDDRELRIVGLLYLETALAGGETILADAWRAVAALPEVHRRRLLAPWKRLHPYQPRWPATQRNDPILLFRGQDRVFSYNSYRFRWALDLEPTPDLEERLATLDAVDQSLADHAFRVPLEPGDALFVNNAEVAHGRTGFVDDPARVRRLVRLWIGRRGPDFGRQVDRPLAAHP